MEKKSPDQIRAEALTKAEQEIQRAEIEAQIVESLPVNPKRVHVYSLYKSVASASYEVKTKQDAFEIYKQFDVLPSYICRGSSTAIKCFDDETAKEVSEIHASVEIDQFKAKLEFFTNTKAGIVRIKIEMPVHLFGHYRKDNPRAVKNYKLEWESLPKTREMFLAIRYSAGSFFGEYSAKTIVYALYDKFEVENQFSE